MTSPLLAAFQQQVQWCEKGGAPFSARVVAAAVRWLEHNDPAHEELLALTPDPLAGAVSLRLLAGLHHLALRGINPWAALWPPGPGEPDDAALESAVAVAWAFHGEDLRRGLASPPQTNEVQRSAALLPGLLHVAAHTGLPLGLLEIGASAGLNLWLDRYRYETPAWQWGADTSALVLTPQWVGTAPTLAPLKIDYRAACDVQPVDLSQPGEDLRLASYIWADQPERLARLRAATQVAAAGMAASGVKVQAAGAAQFLRQQLTLRLPGQGLVLMHSVMWQYMPAAEQATIAALMQAAGAASTPETPLAWLRLEPPVPDVRMELRCQIWPGGEDRLLALCHPHGARIEWLAGLDGLSAAQ